MSKKEIHIVHSCQPLKLEPGLASQLPKTFVILKVMTAEQDEPKKPTGFCTLLGFNSVLIAKELVAKLKVAMK